MFGSHLAPLDVILGRRTGVYETVVREGSKNRLNVSSVRGPR